MDKKTPKPRTEKQQAVNATLDGAVQWLKSKGVSPAVPNPSIYLKASKEGKSDEEIIELIKVKKEERTATATAKKAAAAAAAPAVAVAAPAVANVKLRVRSQKQLNADKAMKNAAASMKASGVKFTGPSYTEYKAAKIAGRNNSDIFEELKVKYPVDVVIKRASTRKNTSKVAAAKANNGVGVGAVPAKANNGATSAVKGSYVCEKCRFVSNSNTRKNNKKNNAVNYSYNEQGY